MVGAAPKYTKRQWIARVAPLIAHRWSVDQICKEADVSRKTYYKYMNLYGADADALVEMKEEQALTEASNRATTIIDMGYDYYIPKIKEAMEREEEEGTTYSASQLLADALKLVKTEGDVNRLFASLNIEGDLNITQINMMENEAAQKIMQIIADYFDMKDYNLEDFENYMNRKLDVIDV